jgi:hypothetical protein
MAKVKKIKMLIPQGTTYEHTFNYAQGYEADGTPINPIDLTGYAAELQFRVNIEDDTPFYTATDATEIVCGNGTAVLTIDHLDSTAWTDYEFVGALEVTSPGGKRTRLVDIEAELSREAVR